MRRLLLRVAPGLVRAELTANGAAAWAAETRFDEADAEDLGNAIAMLAAELPAGGRLAADVCLLAPLAQTRRVTGVPPVRGNRVLNALVTNQATRYFRRNGHPLATSARWATPRSKGDVLAAAVEQRWLDAIGSGLALAGIAERTIATEPEAGGLRFSSTSSLTSGRLRARRQTFWLAGIAAALWITCAALIATRFVHAQASLRSELSRLEAPAEAARSARRAMTGAEHALDSVNATRQHAARALEAVAALSGAMPESGFLTSMEWSDNGSGALTGAAKQSVNVIASLERAGIAQPRSAGAPISEVSPFGPRERFVVQFGVPEERAW